MIVTTSVNELPVTDPAGTTGPPLPLRRLREPRAGAFNAGPGASCGCGDGRGASKLPCGPGASVGSGGSEGCSVGGPAGRSNNLDMALLKCQTRCLELLYQLLIVRRNDN